MKTWKEFLEERDGEKNEVFGAMKKGFQSMLGYPTSPEAIAKKARNAGQLWQAIQQAQSQGNKPLADQLVNIGYQMYGDRFFQAKHVPGTPGMQSAMPVPGREPVGGYERWPS